MDSTEELIEAVWAQLVKIDREDPWQRRIPLAPYFVLQVDRATLAMALYYAFTEQDVDPEVLEARLLLHQMQS